MSINVDIETIKIIKETVATSLTINRTVNPMTGETCYTGNLQYATHTFAADDDNKPGPVMFINQNPGSIYVSASEMTEFFATPLKNLDGSDTYLGVVLAQLMDTKIQDYLTPESNETTETAAETQA